MKVHSVKRFVKHNNLLQYYIKWNPGPKIWGLF